MLRISAAAARLGVTDATLRRWADTGLIPHIALPSGERRFREGDLLAVLRPRRGRPRRVAGKFSVAPLTDVEQEASDAESSSESS